MTAWQPAPDRVSLAPGTVDIWRTRLDLPPSRIQSYRDLLSAQELARAERFRGRRKQREYVISRGLLRALLGQALDCDPASVEFSYSAHNKPMILSPAGRPRLGFNVTHSHEQTLIALCPGQDVGIDVEQLRTNLEFRKLATRFFSTREAAELETYTEVGIPQAFFACWTRKESFVKALGEGIAFGLSEFSVSVDPYQERVELQTHWDESFAAGWTIMNIGMGPEYAAAFAVNLPDCRVCCWQL